MKADEGPGLCNLWSHVPRGKCGSRLPWRDGRRSQLAFGKEVTLLTHGLDKYGRNLADVLLPDGTNVNHTLVKDGWCWWYRKYASLNTELEALEKASTRHQERLVG